MKSDLVDIVMFRHHETERAVLASSDGERENAVWLPLAQIEIIPHGSEIEVTMPEWLAKEKGLI